MTNSSTGSRQWLKFKLGSIVGAPAGAGPGPSRSALLGLRQGWAPGLPVSVPQSCSVRPRRWIFPDPRPLFLHLGLVLVKQSQRLPEKGHVVGTWQTPAPNAFAPRPRRWRQSPGRPPTPPRTAEASSQGLRLPTLRGHRRVTLTPDPGTAPAGSPRGACLGLPVPPRAPGVRGGAAGLRSAFSSCGATSSCAAVRSRRHGLCEGRLCSPGVRSRGSPGSRGRRVSLTSLRVFVIVLSFLLAQTLCGETP